MKIIKTYELFTFKESFKPEEYWEDEHITIEDFEQFLDENDSLIEFVRNFNYIKSYEFRKDHGYPLNIIDFYDQVSPNLWILKAFSFHNTFNSSKWGKLNSMWMDKLNNGL